MNKKRLGKKKMIWLCDFVFEKNNKTKNKENS